MAFDAKAEEESILDGASVYHPYLYLNSRTDASIVISKQFK